MSVVAFDGKDIAADTYCCYGNLVRNETKLWQIGPDVWLGCVGTLAEGIAIRNWLKGGNKPTDLKNTTCLVIRRSKEGVQAVLIEESLVEVPITKFPTAIGSGKDIVMGAMLAGKSAVDAITLVTPYHSDIALPIDAFRIV